MVRKKELHYDEDENVFYVVFPKPSTSDEEHDSDKSSISSGNNNSSNVDIPYLPRSHSTANNVIQSFRKNRIPPIFNSEQIIQLEKSYLDNPYLTRRAQINLARKLNINEDNIKLWFRKRRLIEFVEFDNYDICSTNSDA